MLKQEDLALRKSLTLYCKNLFPASGILRSVRAYIDRSGKEERVSYVKHLPQYERNMVAKKPEFALLLNLVRAGIPWGLLVGVPFIMRL